MVEIPCICPPKDGQPRHDHDTVTLREKLPFRSALACRNAILLAKQEDDDLSVADILAVLTESYLVEGIVAWSLQDEKGKAVEVSKARIRALLEDHPDVAWTIGDAADALYMESVMLPLVAMGQRSSPSTPTGPSTSARNGSANGHRKPSKRSSTTTSQTVAIATTSSPPAGGSNSSPSSP